MPPKIYVREYGGEKRILFESQVKCEIVPLKGGVVGIGTGCLL